MSERDGLGPQAPGIPILSIGFMVAGICTAVNPVMPDKPVHFFGRGKGILGPDYDEGFALCGTGDLQDSPDTVPMLKLPQGYLIHGLLEIPDGRVSPPGLKDYMDCRKGLRTDKPGQEDMADRFKEVHIALSVPFLSGIINDQEPRGRTHQV